MHLAVAGVRLRAAQFPLPCFGFLFMSEERIVELDALRGIAALSVMAYHFTSVYPRLISHRPFADVPQIWCGYFGVELFFMISGFVIFFSAQRAPSMLDFALSRFARLFPAYWAAVLLAAALHWGTGDGAGSALLFQTTVNLTMLQTFFGVKNLDESYWTLALELSFYLWIALAIRVTLARGRRIEWALGLWLAVATVVRLLAVALPYRLTILALVYYGQFFVFGVALYLITQGAARRMTYVIAAWALLMSAFGANAHTPAAGFDDYFPMSLACAALMVVAVWKRPSFLRSSFLGFFGRISYSLYLIHSVVGYFLITQALAAGVSDGVAILLAVIGVVAVGWLCQTVVESPGRKALRRWFASLRSGVLLQKA